MKYLIRLFTSEDEPVFKMYEFEQLPYMPRIGEIIDVFDSPYEVTKICSSFERLNDGEFMIDYIIREVCW